MLFKIVIVNLCHFIKKSGKGKPHYEKKCNFVEKSKRMKKTINILLLLNIICIASLCAQKVVRYPLFDRTDTPEFKIDSIIIDNNETSIYFHYDNRGNASHWINISPRTYIKDNKGDKYYVKLLENIAEGPARTIIKDISDWNGVIHFPHIDSKSIDFIEDESKLSFNIYGVDLTKDGEFPGYTDFSEFNRKKSRADFYFAAENYQKYIDLATPLLIPIRSSFGKLGVADIVPKLIDSHILTGQKDSDYEKYIAEYREICEGYGWAKDLNCSLELAAKLSKSSNRIFELFFDNKLEEACSLLSEFIPLAELVYNDNDTIIAYHQGTYSQMLRQLGRNEESIIWGQKSLDNNRRLNNYGMSYHVTLSDIAPLYEEAGNIEMANQCYKELYHLQEKEGERFTFKHAQTAYNWGSELQRNNKKQEGLAVLENAFKLFGSSEMKMDSLYLSIAQSISMIYYDFGDFKRSVEVWEDALRIVKNRVGEKISLYLRTIVGLADICKSVGNSGKASEYIYEINKEFQSINFTVKDIDALTTYASILTINGDYEKSISIYRKTEEIYKNNNLTNDSRYGHLQLNLARAYLAINDTTNSVNVCNSIFKGEYKRVAYLDKEGKEIRVNASDVQLDAKCLLAQIYQNSNPAQSATLCEEVLLINDDENVFLDGPKKLAYDLIKMLYIPYHDNSTVNRVYENMIANDSIDYEGYGDDALLDFYDYFYQVISKGYIDTQFAQENLQLIKVDQLRIIFDEIKSELLDNFLFLTEKQREKYFNASKLNKLFIPSHLSFVADVSRIESLNAIAYDCVLLTKSILLASSTGLSDIIYRSNDKKLIDLFEKVKNNYNEYSPKQIESYEHDILKKSRGYSDFFKKSTD